MTSYINSKQTLIIASVNKQSTKNNENIVRNRQPSRFNRTDNFNQSKFKRGTKTKIDCETEKEAYILFDWIFILIGNIIVKIQKATVLRLSFYVSKMG